MLEDRSSITEEEPDAASETTNYTYDRIGNRITQDDGSLLTYSYDDLNRLNKTVDEDGETIASYTYDKNGNQLSEITDEKKVTNRYDVLNRLASTDITNMVSVESDDEDDTEQMVEEFGSRTESLYNGDGQRIRKAVTKGTGSSQAVDVKNYYYQDGVVSYTEDGSGAKTSHNIIGLNDNIISTKRYGSDAGYYSYNKDIQGSIMTILDDSGSYKTGYRYTDFGETTKLGDQTFDNEVCYTSGIYDESTGLYYLNARYYDPANSRFLSMDTYRGEKRNPDTLHLYTYCSNNPTNFVDPSGHGTIKPSLVRSGNTTKVEVILVYEGEKMAKAISFHTLKIWNGAFIGPKTYKLFKPNKGHYYRWKYFDTATYLGHASFGHAKIPKKKKKVNVNSTSLNILYLNGGWTSYTNISGSWKIK